ncbi:hypothetical protein SUSAZ_06200 [Sulfolobus acidocaldarius SUSAZ]|nr:hypothetical protein SUSAZ_06200 [Sulfolobus acidocaldarius SUSAZ]
MFQIGFAAHSGEYPVELKEKVDRLINLLRKYCFQRSLSILVGGYWGLMKDIVDVAINKSFNVVVFLPVERELEELPDKVVKIYTGAEFRVRSVMLVRSSDVLVALGGGVGTEIEILIAYAIGKPIYVLTGTGLYTDKLKHTFPDFFDERKIVRVVYSDSVEEIAKGVCESVGVSSRTNYG